MRSYAKASRRSKRWHDAKRRYRRIEKAGLITRAERYHLLYWRKLELTGVLPPVKPTLSVGELNHQWRRECSTLCVNALRLKCQCPCGGLNHGRYRDYQRSDL